MSKTIGSININFNARDLQKQFKANIQKLNLSAITLFLEKLYAYRNILTVDVKKLVKNGFNSATINIYKEKLNEIIFKAQVKKSELLEAENIPGQMSFFGLGRAFDEARKNNSYTKDKVVYNRQQQLTANVISIGKEIEISFSLDKVIDGNYVLVPMELLQPSHIGAMQNPLHFIPEAQPRNRSTSSSGNTTPKIIAERLRPAEIIEGATAFTGAPVINQRGEVIQGNGRAYTMKYYYSNFSSDPKNYLKFIEKNIGCYDFDNSWSKIKQPVLCRMVRTKDNEAIELGQYTQKDLEAVANETTAIKSKTGLVSDAVLDKILDSLLSKDDGEKTLSELIRESDVLKTLIKEAIIRNDDLEIYAKNGVINEAGINFVSKFLLNLIFKNADINTPDIFIQLPVFIQKSIEKAALYVLKVRGDQNINKEISISILGTKDFLQNKNNGTISEWLRQYDIFQNQKSSLYNGLEVEFIRLFTEAKTQKEIVLKFKDYAFWATDKPGDMFEELRPALSKKEAIKKVFKIDLVDAKPRATTSKKGLPKAKKAAEIYLSKLD